MWYRIVPLPLIFRPDLETDGFWSVRTGAASRSFCSGSALTTGTSLLSKNLFSGTGGISSGRTTGLSLFVLTSVAFSVTSLLSERHLWFEVRLHLESSFFFSSFLRFLDCFALALLLRFLLLLLSFSASLSDELSEELDALEEDSDSSDSEHTFFFFSKASFADFVTSTPQSITRTSA